MSLDTGIGAATVTSPGVVLKAAALSAVAPGPLTDNTSGIASSTLLGVPVLPSVPLLADVITAVIALISVGNHNAATLNAQLNAEAIRVEDLIAKQQAAGQQT